MAVIVGAQVDGQFVEQFRVEAAFRQQGAVGSFQEFQPAGNEVVIAAVRHAGAAEEQRDGPDLLVFVGLALRPGFQDGDGPMADEVVELPHRPVDDCALLLAPRPTLGQHRFQHARQEERLKQFALGLVKEQVGVEAAVLGQDAVEGEFDDGLGLDGVAEGAAGALEGGEVGAQPLVQHGPRLGNALVGEGGVGVVDLPGTARVGSALGEVEVAEDALQ